MPINEYDALLNQLDAPRPDGNRYDRLLVDDHDGRASALRETFRQASTTTPDKRTTAITLADRYRMPVDVVERNLDVYQQRAAADAPEYEQLLERAPALTAWLSDRPDHAPAAQDDLDSLERLEHTLTFGASILRGVDSVQGMTGGFLEASGELVGVDRLRDYGRDVRAFNEAQADALGPRTSVFALRGPWDLGQWLKESIGEQIPMMAPILASSATGAAIGTAIAPGVGTTIGAVIGAVVPSFVLGVGEVQSTVKAIDPNTTAPAAAFLGGTAIAALDSVLPGRVGSRLVQTFGRETAEQVARRALLAPVKPALLRATVGGTITGMATEGLTEAVQEAVGAVAGAVGTGTALPDDLWRQLVEAGAAGAVVGGLTEGGASAAAGRRQHARVAAAQQQQVFYDGLAQGARTSKLIARLPQAAQEFLQRATKDGPVAFLYAPIDTFDTYWQSKGVSPDVVAAELTGRPTALADARRAGTDLQIPTAAYAVKLAGTEHHAYFAQELRLDPQGLNTREAQALEHEVAGAAAAADDPRQVQLEAGRQTVHARVLAQALEAGARPAVADAWAVLWADRFATRAQRLGVDPVQLFDRRPPPAIVSEATPAAAVGVADIPPSRATPNETREQRATRRQAQIGALTSTLLRDARTIDPTIAEDTIRQELEVRLDLEAERQALSRESGTGQDLLRAIAGYGGMWWNPRTEGERGEIERYLEFRDTQRVTTSGKVKFAKGERAKWNGVADVFKEGGTTPDEMLTALRQDARFQYMETLADLWDALELALRAEADVDALPGTDELRALGIIPGTAWWVNAWRAPEIADRGVLDEGDSVEPDDGGDASFDPAEFAQRQAKDARAEARQARADGRDDVERRLRELLDQEPAPDPEWRGLKQLLRLLRIRGAGEFRQDDGDLKGAFNPALNTIRLVAGKADLSTFLHESGHAFLEELVDDALTVADVGGARTPAQQQLVDDVHTALRWFGHAGTLEEWRALSVDARRAQHEQFARGFEAYLMEGAAPSAELRAVFARFKTWLVAVYRSLRALRVELTPEVRGVFDRLLATDEAIAAAEAEAQIVPLFTDPAAAGVDAGTFAAYRDVVARASLAAREDLDRRVMRDWRREQEAWWHEQRDVVRAGVIAELNTQPVFLAQAVIRTGKRPDGSIPDFGDGRPLKLSKQDLVEQFGADILKRLPKPYLYTLEGGVPAQVVAESTGFASADAMLQALIAAPPLQRVLDSETDTRMREQHGDLLLEPLNLRDAAESAVADHRAEVIAAELQALTQGMAAAAIPRADTIAAAAAERIARTKVRELRPGLFLQAARRASRQAFDAFAANDRAGAVRAKQQELVSLALYREAVQAKERTQQIRRRLLEYANSPGRRATIGKAGQDYLDQIDGFLERYEFAKVAQVVLDRRESLRKWVATLERQGLPIDLPDEILDDARRINYQDLTVDELAGVDESVQQIAHLARIKGKLLKAAQQRELNAVAGELATSIHEHARARTPTGPGTRRPSQAAGKLREGVFVRHRKIASLAREMDGFVDGGPAWEAIIRPLNDAADQEAVMNADATRRLADLFGRYTAAERARWHRVEYIPAFGAPTDPQAQLSKAERLMVALNWGNEQNRQRLRDGRGWTDAQVQAMLDTLDRRDWEFVQGMWDFLDSYWPAIKAKQERVVGVAPAKVDAVPVFTRFGEFRGGYFPIKFEGELAALPAAHEQAEIASLHKLAAYATATTRRGHLKARAEGAVTLPVRIDFGVVFEHVGQVIHDLSTHEALIDVGRVLRHEAVATAIYETHGPKVYAAFRNTFLDIGMGDRRERDELEHVVDHLRKGSTVVGLGWNLTTSLLQPIGLTQSMVRIGPGWVAKGLARWLRGAVTMERTVEDIYARSAFMRLRGQTINREINEIRNQVGVSTGRFSGWVDATLRTVSADVVTKQGIADSYFYLIQRMQLVADVPTWLGAYEKAIAANEDEARAIALADQAVIDSQGSGHIKDLASVQRGNAYMKLWTNFYSYFNTTYNLFAESKRRAQLQRSPAAVGRLAVDYLLLFPVAATLGALVRGALAGDDEDELLERVVGENLAFHLGTMLLARDLGGAVQGYAGWDGPAGARFMASLSRITRQVTIAARDADPEKMTAAGLRELNNFTGAVFHYPAGQVRRTVEGLAALMDGRTSNPGALLVGAPRDE